ncbi:MAG: hypothetical protein CBB66_01785 [bacterium TMED6]|nr:MAG: hypothetical protein CBB66_01785 [bacterium TMED6]
MFEAPVYINRRKELCNNLGTGFILFLGHHNSPMNFSHNVYPFIQDTNFLYYIGVNMPSCACLIDVEKNKTIFYMNEKTVHDIIWIGKTKSVKSWGDHCGADEIKPLSDLSKDLHKKKNVMFPPIFRADNKLQINELLDISLNDVEKKSSVSLINAIIKQRSVKSSEEIAEIKSALKITNLIHQKSMTSTSPGKYEYEIVAEMEEIIKSNSVNLAYPIIFTKNGQILHNSIYNNQIKDGDLLLNDSGANSLLHYASDITRTFPANGKFTTQQKEIYLIVQEMQETVLKHLKPGVSFLEMHKLSALIGIKRLNELGLLKGSYDEALEKGVYGLFYPHGLGHMLGLDVHDMESLGEDMVGYSDAIKREAEFGISFLRLGKNLEPGFCITVEPGIYFIPELYNQWVNEKRHAHLINYEKFETYLNFGGIRIEDNIFINELDSENLSSFIPKSISEIESIMS